MGYMARVAASPGQRVRGTADPVFLAVAACMALSNVAASARAAQKCSWTGAGLN